MTHETVTTLEGSEVLSRAKRFFQDRVPGNAAFPERETGRLAGVSLGRSAGQNSASYCFI